MLTVLEAINLSAEYLEKKGIESPRLNAELLLADILNIKRLNLYLSYDRPLSEDEKVKYREFIKRRSLFEPLQYIVGSVEFYGMEFQVNKNVLIPRQETEILIDTIINYLDKNSSYKILDIGTGSGNIAITLANHLPESEIDSIDINAEALKVAEKNAEKNSVKEKINFLNKSLFNGLAEKKYDVIVSNPPYISRDQYEDLRPELKNYEPKEALTDFEDGLKYYKVISEKANQLLNKNGVLFFEMGEGQSNSIYKILEIKNFKNIKIEKDYLNIDRVIYGEKN